MSEAMSESEQPQPSTPSGSTMNPEKFTKFKAAVKRQLDDIIDMITTRAELPFQTAIEYPANLDRYNEILEKASYAIASMHTRGECEEELQWQERTLQLREVMLGREHQDTLRNKVDIGITKYDLKLRDPAERTIALAVEDLTTIFRPTRLIRKLCERWQIMPLCLGKWSDIQKLRIYISRLWN